MIPAKGEVSVQVTFENRRSGKGEGRRVSRSGRFRGRRARMVAVGQSPGRGALRGAIESRGRRALQRQDSDHAAGSHSGSGSESAHHPRRTRTGRSHRRGNGCSNGGRGGSRRSRCRRSSHRRRAPRYRVWHGSSRRSRGGRDRGFTCTLSLRSTTAERRPPIRQTGAMLNRCNSSTCGFPGRTPSER